MADDPDKRGKQDRERINIHEPYELRHWSKHFNVSQDELKRAVDKVGVMVKDVEKELKGRG
jgi:predicted transcriptional regulator